MHKALVKTTYDSHKNVVVHLSGVLSKDLEWWEVLTFADLKDSPAKVRIDNILFALQTGLVFHLWWRGKDNTFILPIEGRGNMNFEGYQGMQPPEGTEALIISTNSVKTDLGFFMMLDLVK